MITRAREYLDDMGLPSAEMLRSVLREHQGRAAEMKALRDAYNAKNSILDRQRRSGLPNNRIAHPFARYITTIATGCMIGRPVSYSLPEENETLQRIQDIFHLGNEAAENEQLARDQSIYGKGVEYVHIDDNDLPHTTAVCPETAFVVYSDTYDQEPLFGVYFCAKAKADGTPDGWRVWAMSESAIAQYETQTLQAVGAPVSVDEHFFGGVPLIEYWNDESERGDFEWVLPQLDAYDKLQSDRVNDKEQFVEKLLVITGAVLEEDEQGRKPMQQLKEDHALQLPDNQSKAEYLTSEMRESDVEVLRRALADDIHKLSLIPDLSDEKFGGNASGVAMQYKLMGFEQLIRVKERWFSEGLRSRLKLYNNYLTARGMAGLDLAAVKITFQHTLPVNLQENAQVVQLAMNSGVLSLPTAVRLLHNGDEWSDRDIGAEVEAIEKERQREAMAGADAAMFED